MKLCGHLGETISGRGIAKFRGREVLGRIARTRIKAIKGREGLATDQDTNHVWPSVHFEVFRVYSE